MSHFNEQANEWDTDSKIAMVKLLAKRVSKALALHEPIDIIDFGTGTSMNSIKPKGFQ